MRWSMLSLVGGALCSLATFGYDAFSAAEVRGDEAATRGGGSAARDASGGGERGAAADYVTAPVERGTLEDVVTASGALQPVETVEIGSQIPGEVARLLVDFNSDVRKGDVLAQLDQRAFEARLREQASALAVAKEGVRVQRARLDRATIDLETVRAGKAVLEARTEGSRAQMDVAKSAFDRKMILQTHRFVPIATVQEAQTELASKAALLKENASTLDQHGLSLEGAKADVRRIEAELAQAEAGVFQREAGVQVAQIDLDRTVIRSPIDGVVVGRFINQGQMLAENIGAHPIFMIARDLGRMEIHARVDETDIGRLKPGQRAAFTVDAYPGRRFDAVVRQVRKAAEISQNVVTYTVVLATDNRDGSLLPGMTALVRVTVDQADGVLKVPLAALRFKPGLADRAVDQAADGRPSVWIVKANGRLEHVRIATGPANGDQAVLTAGPVGENDRVVVGEAARPPEWRLFGVRLGF